MTAVYNCDMVTPVLANLSQIPSHKVHYFDRTELRFKTPYFGPVTTHDGTPLATATDLREQQTLLSVKVVDT